MAVSKQHYESETRKVQVSRKAKSNTTLSPELPKPPLDLFGLFDEEMGKMRQKHAVIVSSVLDVIQPQIECGIFTDLGGAWSNGRVRRNSKLHLHFSSLEQTLGKKLGGDGYFIAEEDGWLVMHAGEFLLENFLGNLLKGALRHKDFVAGVLAASPQESNGELTSDSDDLAVEFLAKDVAALFRERGGRIAILENNPDWRADSARKAVA